MHCYTPAYYHHQELTPPPTATTRTTHNYHFYPFNRTKTATKYPTRNYAGQLRLVAKAASGGGSDFAVAAEESRVSFYEVLGVAECGTVGEVKKAYKQLARKYHPDVSPPGRVEEYQRRFILVKQAYDTLSDPALRALYDRDLAKGLQFPFSSRRRFHHYDIDQALPVWFLEEFEDFDVIQLIDPESFTEYDISLKVHKADAGFLSIDWTGMFMLG